MGYLNFIFPVIFIFALVLETKVHYIQANNDHVDFNSNPGEIFNRVLLTAAEHEFEHSQEIVGAAVKFQWDKLLSVGNNNNNNNASFLLCSPQSNMDDKLIESLDTLQNYLGKEQVKTIYTSRKENLMCYLTNMNGKEHYDYLKAKSQNSKLFSFMQPIPMNFKIADNLATMPYTIKDTEKKTLTFHLQPSWNIQEPEFLVQLLPGVSRSASEASNFLKKWMTELIKLVPTNIQEKGHDHKLKSSIALNRLSESFFWPSYHHEMHVTMEMNENGNENKIFTTQQHQRAAHWLEVLKRVTEGESRCQFDKLKFHGEADDYFFVSGLEFLSSKSLSQSKLEVEENAQDCIHTLLSFLASKSEVIFVQPRPKYEFKNAEAQWITQSFVQDKFSIYDIGLTGDGQIVGMADSGIDQMSCFFYDEETGPVTPFYPDKDDASEMYNEPYFDPNKRKLVQYIAYVDDADPISGHGTHVAGSVIGVPYDSLKNNDFKSYKKRFADKICPEEDHAFMCGGYCEKVPVECRLASGLANITCYDEHIKNGTDKNAIAAIKTCRTDKFGCPLYNCEEGKCKNDESVSYQLTDGSFRTCTMQECQDNPHIEIPKNHGMGINAKIAFFDIGNTKQELLLPLHLNIGLYPHAYAVGAKLHTNSWGMKDGDTRYYSNDMENDIFSWQNKDFLPLFAAGNDGANTWGGSVGSPGNSKNTLTVGAGQTGTKRKTLGPDIITSFSSKGPSKDGRIKPDVIGPGHSISSTMSGGYNQTSNTCGTTFKAGTSMATPVIAGNAALVRQYFEDEFYIKHLKALGLCEMWRNNPYLCKKWNPSSALVKAMLIHSAQKMEYILLDKQLIDLGPTPDPAQGFGRVQLDAVLPTDDESFSLFARDWDKIDPRSVRTFEFNIKDYNVPLIATLVWTDPPGYIFAKKQLMHDLDLTITDPSGEVFYANNLPTYDELNNVEKILISNPMEGTYKIQIQADVLPYGEQPYALVVTGHGFIANTYVEKKGENQNRNANFNFLFSWILNKFNNYLRN